MAGELAFFSEYLSQLNNRLIFYDVNVKSHLCQNNEVPEANILYQTLH